MAKTIFFPISNAGGSVYILKTFKDNGYRVIAGDATPYEALRAHNEKLAVAEVMQKDIPVCQPDSLVAEIMPAAAVASYPIAVVDGEKRLMGIVTKANVLASLI